MQERPFYVSSIIDVVINGNQLHEEEILNGFKDYQEVVNGSQVIPDRLFEEINKFKGKGFEFIKNGEVEQINQKGPFVDVYIKTGVNTGKVERADNAIVTTTARAVSLMKFDPPLPYMKRHALDSLEYTGSIKIFLKFKSAFWARDNKIPAIAYGGLFEKHGGTAVSDDILRQVIGLLFF